MSADAILSVDHLPPEQRFLLWRDSISTIFDVSRERAHLTDTPFQAELRARKVGDLMLARTKTMRQSWQRSAVTMARTAMDQVMLQVYLEGTQHVTWRGGSLEMPRHGILVYDLTQEMRAETSDFANLSLILPRAQLEEFLPRVEDFHMCALPAELPAVAHLRDHMLALWQSPDQALAGAQNDVISEMVAAAMRAGKGGDSGVASLSAGPLLSLLRRHIEERLTDHDLGPEEIALRFGLSRSRLYELFAPFHGVAIYIRDRRLRAARRLLMDPARRNLSIGAIARLFCFNHSDFSRAFQNRYGLSPRAARHYALLEKEAKSVLWLAPRYEAFLRGLAA